MDIVKHSLAHFMSIIVMLMACSLTVNAEEGKEFKDLSKASELAPPPPPGEDITPGVRVQHSSKMRSHEINNVKHVKEEIDKHGYREVDDDAMNYLSLDVMKHKFMPLDQILKITSSPLSDITIKTGVFKTMSFEGVIATSPARKTKKMTRVMRYYTLTNGNVVMLSEYDFNAAQMQVTIPEEFINVSVNGVPAMLIVKKTKHGKFFTELTWSTTNKLYSLKLEGKAEGLGDKNELVILASGIHYNPL